MPLTPAKCTECGGFVEVDNEKRLGVCQHCGNPFVVEEAIQTFNTYYKTTDNFNTTHNYGDGAVVNVFENQNSVSSLLERVFIFLEEGDFVRANEYCEKVLDSEPKNARAYLGKLMVELKIKKLADFNVIKVDFSSNKNFRKVMDFGDENTKAFLTKNLNRIRAYTKQLEKDLAERKRKSAEQRKIIEAQKKQRELEERKKAEIECAEAQRKHLEKLKFLKAQREYYSKFSGRIAASKDATIGIKSDGKLVVTSRFWATMISRKFENLVSISVNGSFSEFAIGLKSDGTVIADGVNEYGRCNVLDWRNIVAIATGEFHTVGLKSNGTVVATKPYARKSLVNTILGYNSPQPDFGQSEVQGWTDIVAISAGKNHTVGLKSDGTVVAVGLNEYGQCDVDKWNDIVAISAGNDVTYGIKADGTVVAVGGTYSGGVTIGDNWTNIVAISVGSVTIALKADGTVVDKATAYNNYEKWTDIVAISAGKGRGHAVGLRSDGTVVAVGNNDYGQCNVEKWKLF